MRRLKNVLENERQARTTYLAGDIRRYESDYKDLHDHLEFERGHKKLMVSKNNKGYLATAKKLGEERTKLLDEISVLKDQVYSDKHEIKQLRQQVADKARSMRAGENCANPFLKLKRVLVRPQLAQMLQRLLHETRSKGSHKR